MHKDLSYKIIGLAIEVHRKLGYGFIESVYENALMVLFRREGIAAEQQVEIEVRFEGEVVGRFIPDVLVEGKIILELKAQETLLGIHRAQTLNYIKATEIRVAYLINFGKKSLEYERFIR